MTDEPRFLKRLKGLAENLALCRWDTTMTQKQAASDIRDALVTIDHYRRALESIASSTCCEACDEAAKVARLAIFMWDVPMIPEIEARRP